MGAAGGAGAAGAAGAPDGWDARKELLPAWLMGVPSAR